MVTRSTRRPTSAVQEARDSAVRAALVAAATGIAGREGLQGVTIRGVAKAAGCSVSSVYAYFVDRDAIIEAILQYANERAGELIRRPLPAGLTFEERLGTLLKAMMERARSLPRLAVDLEFPSPELTAPVSRARAQRQALLREWLERNAGPGDMGGHSPEEAAETLATLTRAFGTLALQIGGDWDVEGLTQDVIRSVLGWIRSTQGGARAPVAGSKRRSS